MMSTDVFVMRPAMFAAIAPGLPLTFDLKLATGCLFTGEEDDDAAATYRMPV